MQGKGGGRAAFVVTSRACFLFVAVFPVRAVFAEVSVRGRLGPAPAVLHGVLGPRRGGRGRRTAGRTQEVQAVQLHR